ncbi:MAG: ADP-ribosylglycohydrolase family protein [Coriobacteriales bacterium]
MAEKRRATLRDAVYGLAVGDALGVPYEFRERGSFECTGMVGGGAHGKPAGTWSDDTSMTLATCDSIRVNAGRVVPEDLLRRFRLWAERGAYTIDGLFDIGGTTSRSIERGTGCSDERDCGNGSLMRIVPLAFTSAGQDEVAAASAVTHAHPACAEVCWDFVRVARQLIDGALPLEVPAVRERAGRPAEEVRSGGFVRDTYDAVLWCLANTGNYAECVLAAVNLSDDADSTAAVAGALAGIVYGAHSIPAEWLAALRGREIIDGALFRQSDICLGPAEEARRRALGQNMGMGPYDERPWVMRYAEQLGL